jgi:transcriptional regulator with PAS, ATPase and Fis domain
LIGESAAMRRVLQLIERAAPTDANVLILGANGTGKELVARELWRRSLRKDEAFVSVDLGAVSESLFESELFGHRKGAFTGAVSDRTGRLQAASGGTLFLDEIGNLPLHLQNKLLTVLEQRQVVPVGSNKPVPIDVRLICATNMPLQRMMQEGSFREDLYYRINTVELPLPALHERPEDIIPLLEYYLGHYAHKYRMPVPRLAPGAQAALRAHRWPGNVRELRHAAERAVILGGGEELTAGTLLPVQAADATPLHALPPDTGATLNLEELEREAVATALRLHAGNISQAAKALGITRTALYRRMEKHGL